MKANLSEIRVNTDGDEIIYETPGDAERGNPLDIITIAEAMGGTDVTGLEFDPAEIVKRLALVWNDYERVKLALECRDATIRMACDRLGGLVEGRPTAPLNFLQRIDELVRLEAASR